MFTQYSRPHTPDAIRALWTGEAQPAKQPSQPKTLKPSRPVFGKRKR